MSVKKSLTLLLCMALLPLAASAEIADRAEILQGHVTLIQTGTTDLVVTVDHEVDLNNTIEQAFVYRTDELLPTDLPELDGPARVIVKPSSVLIVPEDGRKVFLAIAQSGLQARRIQVGSTGTAILDRGFQLSRVKGELGSDAQSLADGLLASAERSGFVQGENGLSASFLAAESGCISGGEGAESCSLGGDVEIVGVGGGVECDVSCRDGYDACCDTSGCHCQAS